MAFLLLRPLAKCQSSALAFEQANLPTVACGLIDTIEDEDAISQLPEKIANLHNNVAKDVYLIVTSTIAAKQCVLMKGLWPDNLRFFAVGSSTGQILEESGFAVTVPTEPRTEGLLALRELQEVAGRVIIIMKGFGGRELLFDTLVARAAKVTEWEVYKRVKLDLPIATQDWRAEQIHCIIATSGEVIQAAFDNFPANWLNTLHWIVVSQRTADIAAKLGVSKIEISHNASDQALIQCAQQLVTRTRHFSEH